MAPALAQALPPTSGDADRRWSSMVVAPRTQREVTMIPSIKVEQRLRSHTGVNINSGTLFYYRPLGLRRFTYWVNPFGPRAFSPFLILQWSQEAFARHGGDRWSDF